MHFNASPVNEAVKKYKLGHKMISVVRTITYKTSHDLTFLHGYDYTHRQTDPRTAHC